MICLFFYVNYWFRMIIAARIRILFLLLTFSTFHLFKFSARTFFYTSFFHIGDHGAIFFSEMLKFFSLNSNLKIDDDRFEKLKKNWKIRLILKKWWSKKKNLCFADEKFYIKILIGILIRTNSVLLKDQLIIYRAIYFEWQIERKMNARQWNAFRGNRSFCAAAIEFH